MSNELKYEAIKDMIQKFHDEKAMTDYIHPDLLPDIALYMDQVTTFMDEHLKNTKRYPDDKILTKTMINNYAKNDLLPAPEKKKYSKEHLLLLTFIYYYKSFLSINDIQTLLKPITDNYFNSDSDLNLERIYEDIYNTQMALTDELFEDLESKYHYAGEAFPDASAKDRNRLSLFSFVCTLSYDISVKKQLIEHIIDYMHETEAAAKDSAKESSKELKKEKDAATKKERKSKENK